MLRYGLRECFGITSCKIELGKYGKPFLADYPNVHFNISHCDIGNAVVVANFPVGVDIQEVRPFSWNVAKHVCSGQELTELEKCANRDRLFIKMWTAKESYAKIYAPPALNIPNSATTIRQSRFATSGTTSLRPTPILRSVCAKELDISSSC